jgi:hypothetical protein
MRTPTIALVPFAIAAALSLSCESSSTDGETDLVDQGGKGPPESHQIVGMWTCDVIRAANQSSRPWYVVFRDDGTAVYSSATNTTNLPGSGFNARTGNGDGEWSLVGEQAYNFRSVEYLYRAGNAGGRWLVDFTFHLRTDQERAAAAGKHRLCTGSIPGDTCPRDTHVRATIFEFDEAGGCECLNAEAGCEPTSACLNNPIVGERDIFNNAPGGNGVITAVIRCNPLEEVTTYGSTEPVFPIPAPVTP